MQATPFSDDPLERPLQANLAPILGAEVGRGGMGRVLAASDPALDRRFAVKVIHDGDRGTVADRRRTRRLVREARLLAGLQHPGVVPVFELGVTADRRPYYSMPLIEGLDLDAILTRHRSGDAAWPRNRLLEILAQVCDTVAYAHDRGVIHRDLKPANLMVADSGAVYVMDWGLARRLDDPDRIGPGGPESTGEFTTQPGALLGTPEFMAPEQLGRIAATLGPAADVHALGAVLYTVLAGAAPYRAGVHRTTREVVEAARLGPPEPLPEVASAAPAPLVAVCECAMRADPSARYADARAMAADLRAYLDRRVVRSYRTGAWAELVAWAARNPVVAAAISATVLVLLGAAASVAWSEHSTGVAIGAQRDAAVASAVRIRGLADRRRFDLLEADAAAAWPATSGRLAELRRLRRRVAELHARRASHAAELARLTTGDRTDPTGAWQREQLAGLLEALDRLPAVDASLAKREARAADSETRTLRGAVAAQMWASCRAAVANAPAYGGLDLPPQEGLLPIGRNDQSGLWEFRHLPSGDGPEGLGGIVLVLLPGGTFAMGCRPPDAGHPRGTPSVDPSCRTGIESPVMQVTLGPFFIGTHEVTQGQWRNAELPNRSKFQDAADAGRLPVHDVTFDHAREFARRMGLVLPTEAQWEYACRGGTSTVYWCGDDPADLRQTDNVATQDLAAWFSEDALEPWSDGARGPCRVGSYKANPFGLFDVHGNVREWCRSPAFAYGPSAVEGPAGRPVELGLGGGPMARGGNWRQKADGARAAFRTSSPRSFSNDGLGLRVAKEIAR